MWYNIGAMAEFTAATWRWPLRLEDFPRPAGDNGRGLHWSPSPYPPTGSALDFWIDELHAMHIKWLKVIDDGTGSSLAFCSRLVKEGIMPIVRIQNTRPHPRRLSPQEKDAIRRLIDAGVRYFETDHEPDLPASWGEAMPPNWFDLVIDAFIEDADFVLEAGGLPAIPAMELRLERNPVRAIVDRGRGDLFERGTWWAIHNFTLNRPLEYPDDEVNRTGRAVTEDEYEQHHPWGWNEPREIIDRWRAEGKQPDTTLADDPFCFRAYELAGQMAQEVLGYPIPIISTEGGAVTGVRDDRRYPRLDPWTAAEWTVRINEFLQREAPPWYFTLCHWLIADRRIDPSRPHAWEPHCWYTHWWDEQFGFHGTLPVVERVKAMPSLERPRPVSQPTPSSEPTPVVPEEPHKEEASMPALGILAGRVHGDEGAPLPGTQVEVHTPDGEVLTQVTDEDGRFRFEDLSPGEYRLLIPERGEVGLVDITAGEVQDVEIQLEPLPATAPSPTEEAPAVEEEAEQEVAVEHVSEEPSVTQPEEDVTTAEETIEESVTQEEPPPAEEEVPAAEEAPPTAPEARADRSRVVGHAPGARPGIVMRLIDASGEAREVALDEERRFEFADLPAGTYRLEMEGIGLVREHIELDGENTVEVIFPLKGIIQGLVMGGTPEMVAELVAETYGWTRAVALSPQGQYRFVELPPGKYHVNVEGHTVGPVEIGGEGTTTMPTLDVRPPHRAGLQGKVMNDKEEVLPDIPVRLMRGGDVVASTETALNGSFSFENLPPGDYHLVVVGPPDVVRPVHLEQDKVLVLDIVLAPATIPEEERAPAAAEEGAVTEPPAAEEEEVPAGEVPAEPKEEPEPEVTVLPPETAGEEAPAAEEQPEEPETPPALEEGEAEDMVPAAEEEPAAPAVSVREAKIETYVLLPSPDHPLCRPMLLAALPYLRRGRVVAGFRVEEARQARQVLLVGDKRIHPEDVENALREVGCEVDRVTGDISELVTIFRATARALKEQS